MNELRLLSVMQTGVYDGAMGIQKYTHICSPVSSSRRALKLDDKSQVYLKITFFRISMANGFFSCVCEKLHLTEKSMQINYKWVSFDGSIQCSFVRGQMKILRKFSIRFGFSRLRSERNCLTHIKIFIAFHKLPLFIGVHVCFQWCNEYTHIYKKSVLRERRTLSNMIDLLSLSISIYMYGGTAALKVATRMKKKKISSSSSRSNRRIGPEC